jgi:hypothetical protein
MDSNYLRRNALNFFWIWIGVVYSCFSQFISHISAFMMIISCAISILCVLSSFFLQIFFCRMWHLKWTKRNIIAALKSTVCKHYSTTTRYKIYKDKPMTIAHSFCWDCRERVECPENILRIFEQSHEKIRQQILEKKFNPPNIYPAD